MAIIGAVAQGKTNTIINESTTVAGIITEYFTVETDSVLISLYADVVSGTLDVSVYTLTDNGKELGVITFPQLTAPTSELLLKKAAVVMSRVKVVATYTGATTFEVRARGISTGETSVKIIGAATGKTSKETVTTSTTILIPAALNDRSGLILKNFSTTGTLYIGYTLIEATSLVGYPISPGESLGMDISSGVAVYAVASAGTIDVRIMEAAF